MIIPLVDTSLILQTADRAVDSIVFSAIPSRACAAIVAVTIRMRILPDTSHAETRKQTASNQEIGILNWRASEFQSVRQVPFGNRSGAEHVLHAFPRQAFDARRIVEHFDADP